MTKIKQEKEIEQVASASGEINPEPVQSLSDQPEEKEQISEQLGKIGDVVELPSFKIEKQPENIEEFNTELLSLGFSPETLSNIETQYLASLKEPTSKNIGVILLGTNKSLLNLAVTGALSHLRFGYDLLNVDPLEKLSSAIELIMDDEEYSEFVIYPERVFTVSPVTLADIQILKTKGELKSGCGLNDRTIEVCAENKLKTRRISPDCPFYIERSKLVSFIEAFPDLDVDEVDFVSLYYNYFYPNVSALELNWKSDNMVLPIISEKPDIKQIEQWLSGKKFVRLQSDSLIEYFQELLS
ncbi:hypothetical protein E2605_18610 [Dysgonomonas capnocytophagoides]|uniref:Uncharacterized protein n=1 Tax=Dysgonomonas capnocytophagoides TaxID=45254 RepID=A0A4Y8KTS1_9BACT|nr:hypothetical protein [Dysgonomonas capnocytophagoides]TFD92572.1 hypothetical protein E2605_18610 [Dysgonomonas capnocytophagoides]